MNDPNPAPSGGGGDGPGVEKPRARQLPHDEQELIAGQFTTMTAPCERMLADPSFLRAPDDGMSSVGGGNSVKLPPIGK